MSWGERGKDVVSLRELNDREWVVGEIEKIRSEREREREGRRKWKKERERERAKMAGGATTNVAYVHSRRYSNRD